MQRNLIPLLIGLAFGAAIGVGIGWLAPIGNAGAAMSALSNDNKADYAVMVGMAYARDGDWDAAQARLGALAEPDLAGYLVVVTESYIAEGRNPDDIRALAALAARSGYVTPPMIPYLPATPTGP